jgi:hypothetical protein
MSNKIASAEELLNSVRLELVLQKEEKEKLALELSIAFKKMLLQKEVIEKWESELKTAELEHIFQSNEKDNISA